MRNRHSIQRKITLLSALLFLFPICVQASEQVSDEHEADRKALLKLLAVVETAINKNEISTLLPYLDENVVITHQNAHVARGKEEVVSYNEKMTKGPDAVIKKLTTTATNGGPAYFHGDDVAIGYGTAVDHVVLKSGMEFILDVAWSATLIKKDGVWMAAAIHFSTNVMDNAILNKARGLAWWTGGIGILLGLMFGWFLRSRKRS
ncbi:MAG: hypothetical protein K1563_13130 [Candidatus Thiodiazotropha sp. (ex. Lucinisca nassula)]|nr:hypothetical protein [Candidatus Thiodiazotropha sp. (ex. Lucinisca nassula)]MBW9274623.1 hypothetical protein [Candidatus Thiodiazotropha sp. (ex. Lucinisca nassula)]